MTRHALTFQRSSFSWPHEILKWCRQKWAYELEAACRKRILQAAGCVNSIIAASFVSQKNSTNFAISGLRGAVRIGFLHAEPPKFHSNCRAQEQRCYCHFQLHETALMDSLATAPSSKPAQVLGRAAGFSQANHAPPQTCMSQHLFARYLEADGNEHERQLPKRLQSPRRVWLSSEAGPSGIERSTTTKAPRMTIDIASSCLI